MATASTESEARTSGTSPFVLDPFLPCFGWTDRIVRCLSDADRLAGELAGQGAQLSNPHVLIRPFVRREVVLSSKIERTQATLGELLVAEAGATVDRSPDDLREVGNTEHFLKLPDRNSGYSSTLPRRSRK